MRRGLNGETVFAAKDVTVGYKGRNPVTVSVRMERLDRRDAYETVDHQQVARPLDFSLTSDVWKVNRSDIIEGGATVEPLRQITRYADGWDAAKVRELIALAPWHLNAMTAGCAHQEPVMTGGRPDLDRTSPCPVTGYKYGSAWLVRPLPDGLAEKVRALFGS
jgi:hypothetical protein